MRIKMDNKQKDEFNLQIRRILKKFGIQAHNHIKKKIDEDISSAEISLKLEINGKLLEELKTNIKIE